ncbi:MAG: ACT domain-containing protein [Streptosporangiales bacterium]
MPRRRPETRGGAHRSWLPPRRRCVWLARPGHAVTARPRSLQILSGRYAVCRIPPSEPVPVWVPLTRGEPLVAVTRTEDEISVVCDERAVPDSVRAERPWSALRVCGPVDFSLTGVLASLADPLRDAGISVLALSTYDTDYALVPADKQSAAIGALERAGHVVTPAVEPAESTNVPAESLGKVMSFGYEGDDGLGDRLLAAVLRGEKTATSSLAIEYLSGEPLPRVGERLPLVDHKGKAYGTVETTAVTIVPLHLVGDDVARDEGEGFADDAEWRRAHIAFWEKAAEMIRADAGDPTWQLRETEPVVVEWFRLIDRVS